MRIIVVAIAVFLFGCGTNEPIIFDFPTSLTRGTEILTADDASSIKGFAIALDQRSIRLPLELDPERTTRLEAMIYEQTPAELGLTEGELTPHSEDISIRPPHLLFQTTIKNEVVDPWDALLAPSQRSRQFLPPIGCAKFQPTQPFVSTDEDNYRTGTAIDASSALLIARSSTDAAPHYYLADKNAVTRLGDLLPGHQPRQALSTPDGKIWISTYRLADTARVLFRGDLVNGFTAVAPPPEDFRCFVSDMDYARDEAGDPAIYTIDGCGNIDRLRAGVWTRLKSAPDILRADKFAWVGREELVYILENRQLWRFKTDGTDELTSTDVEIDSLISVATVDGFGTFAGMSSGWVLKFDGTTWGTFRPPFIGTVGALSFARFEGNLLIGGTDGDIHHWVEPTFCEDPTYVGIDFGIIDLIPLDFGVIASGVQLLTTGERRFFIAVLKRAD